LQVVKTLISIFLYSLDWGMERLGGEEYG